MYIEGNNLELNEDRIRFEGEQKELGVNYNEHIFLINLFRY